MLPDGRQALAEPPSVLHHLQPQIPAMKLQELGHQALILHDDHPADAGIPPPSMLGIVSGDFTRFVIYEYGTNPQQAAPAIR